VTLPTLYKLSTAANALGPDGPSERTLRREVAAGRLVAKRFGRCLRVSDVELTRWALDTGSPIDPSPSSGPATAPDSGESSRSTAQLRAIDSPQAADHSGVNTGPGSQGSGTGTADGPASGDDTPSAALSPRGAQPVGSASSTELRSA